MDQALVGCVSRIAMTPTNRHMESAYLHAFFQAPFAAGETVALKHNGADVVIRNHEQMQLLGQALLHLEVVKFVMERNATEIRSTLDARIAALESDAACLYYLDSWGLAPYINEQQCTLSGSTVRGTAVLHAYLACLFSHLEPNQASFLLRSKMEEYANHLSNTASLAPAGNMKGPLMTFTQHHGLPEPQYHIEAHGPSHSPDFHVSCRVGDIVGVGRSHNKKEAESSAAAMVLDQLTAALAPASRPTLTGTPMAMGSAPEVLNWKAALQEYLQKRRKSVPEYNTTGSGTSFRCVVVFQHPEAHVQSSAEGSGRTKKDAEQRAAKAAMQLLAPM
eukprot:GILJ01004062.1.p1 GENE.GILJ01004062.1~~GILJ01004062.1.p1  ORF type:complete len:334 (+),score=40.34 GILJ01004062.1:43-1044(+)